MTEGEWLASEEPAAMLGYLTGSDWADTSHEWNTRISDRKLRLFAEACEALCTCPTRTKRDAEKWAWTSEAPDCPCTYAVRAALLRDLVGNPFRPVVPVVEVLPSRWPNSEYHFRPVWLTPTVLALATAAYEERGEVECQECKGQGYLYLSCPRPGAKPGPRSVCPSCYKGRVKDGTLDPDRLAVLSDALEEAGCDNSDILRHLRGEEPEIWTHYEPPQTVWRPLRGPHVRGCWVVDLILGKE